MKTYTKTEALLLWSQKITEGVMPGFDDSRNKCCYRSSCGKECAIGVLIPHDIMPDEYYFGVRNLHEEIVKGTKQVDVDFDQLIEGLSVSQLVTIQAIHDEVAKRSIHRPLPSVCFRKTFFHQLRHQSNGMFSDVPDDVWEKVLQEDNSPKE